METILEKNIPIWEECIATPFIRGLGKGALAPECFRTYMVQDSIYLKHYARIYGKMIYHAENMRDIKLYYRILGFVTDTESAVRLKYLKEFGMTDDDIEAVCPLPENREYIDFLLEIAKRGDEKEMLMAVLPCMISYSYIFRKLAADCAGRDVRYRDFIEDYADDFYAKDCKMWADFADRKCADCSDTEKERLSGIFEKGSRLELEFWRMPCRRRGPGGGSIV